MEVDLRPVECTVALVHHEIQPTVLKSLAQPLRRKLPHLVRTHRVLWTRGEFRLVREAERAVYLVKEVNGVLDLALNLVRGHKEMRVILREVADAEKSVQRTRELMAMHEPEFREAQRQIAVAVQLRAVDEHTAGAVHRLDRIVFLVDLGGIHILTVVEPMSRGLPQLAAEDHGCADLLIAVAAMHLAPVFQQLIAQDHAVRVEEREARPLLMDAEEVKLPAELAMVALCRLLKHMEVGIQILLLLERRAVDTLQHLVLLAAAPVCTRNTLQFECLDLARTHDVRTRAEIRELALCIGGDDLVLGQILDQLDLVVLALRTEIFDCLRTRNLAPLGFQILLDNLLHFLFEVTQIGLRQLTVNVKVVVEPILDRRTNGELHIAVRIEPLHRLCQDMCGSVAQRMATARILKGQHLECGILCHGRCQIDDLPVQARCKCFLCERVAHALHDIQQRRSRLCLTNGAIRQCQLYHRTLSLPIYKSPAPVG